MGVTTLIVYHTTQVLVCRSNMARKKMAYKKSPVYFERIMCCHCGVEVLKEKYSVNTHRNHPECGPCNHDKCTSCGLRIGEHHDLIPNKLVKVELTYYKLMEHLGKENKQQKHGKLKLCKLCYMASKKRTLRLHGNPKA